jgi:hypothetical protein
MTKLKNAELIPSGLKSTYFAFEGGVNMVDPSLSLEPGELVAANNFEIDIRGRYRRIDGYERFDGQTLPSQITFYRIPFTVGTAIDSVFDSAFGVAFDMQVPSIGDLVKGATSGAIGSVLNVGLEDITGDDATGTFPTSDAEGYVYFTVVSGTLQDGETMYFLNKDSAFGSAFNVEYG